MTLPTAQALAGLQIEKAKIDAQRRRAEADVGPVRYLAELIGAPASDLERPVRLLTLALVAVLDPMAVALLLAAGAHTARAGFRVRDLRLRAMLGISRCILAKRMAGAAVSISDRDWSE